LIVLIVDSHLFLFCRAYRPFGLRCEPPAKQLATHRRACLQSKALSEFISQTKVEKISVRSTARPTGRRRSCGAPSQPSRSKTCETGVRQKMSGPFV